MAETNPFTEGVDWRKLEYFLEYGLEAVAAMAVTEATEPIEEEVA